jgi:hypothetical protein
MFNSLEKNMVLHKVKEEDKVMEEVMVKVDDNDKVKDKDKLNKECRKIQVK